LNFASKPSPVSIPKIFSLSFSSRVLLLFIASLLFAAGFYLYFFHCSIYHLADPQWHFDDFQYMKKLFDRCRKLSMKKSNFHLTNCFISSESNEWREESKIKKCHDFVCSAGKHTFCISFFDCHHTLDIMECVHLREKNIHVD
jgi:hypothetical protein